MMTREERAALTAARAADEARAEAALAAERARAEKAERERDEAVARAGRAEAEVISLQWWQEHGPGRPGPEEEDT